MHDTLLHREAEARNRATVLSMNSMVAFAAFSVAAPLLGVRRGGRQHPGRHGAGRRVQRARRGVLRAGPARRAAAHGAGGRARAGPRDLTAREGGSRAAARIGCAGRARSTSRGSPRVRRPVARGCPACLPAADGRALVPGRAGRRDLHPVVPRARAHRLRDAAGVLGHRDRGLRAGAAHRWLRGRTRPPPRARRSGRGQPGRRGGADPRALVLGVRGRRGPPGRLPGPRLRAARGVVRRHRPRHRARRRRRPDVGGRGHGDGCLDGDRRRRVGRSGPLGTAARERTAAADGVLGRAQPALPRGPAGADEGAPHPCRLHRPAAGRGLGPRGSRQ